MRQTIMPALERGAWVICDRFADSTRVYQGELGDVDARLIARWRSSPSASLSPTSPSSSTRRTSGLARAAKRRGDAPIDRFEGEAFEFHKKLREAYLELAEREPNRCVLIDASADAATVVRVRLGRRQRAARSGRRRWSRTSPRERRRHDEVPHPRETLSLFGHAAAEQALLEAYRGGRMPHAWLIGGPRGIGKATLAYRMARFVLAHPDPAHVGRAPARLALPRATIRLARRVAAQAHPDLLVLERVDRREAASSSP